MAPEPVPSLALVVDDDPVNRALLARAVEREGHAVRTAAGGAEALTVLDEAPPDILLLDLLMPEVDGFAVLSALRTSPALADLPVLVISGVDDTESVARAIEMGAVDVLPKPVEPTLLRVRLRTALQHRALRRLEQQYLNQELALRRQERLATLGRLSAGLAHELNNPAAAAVRTARRLEETLADADDLLRSIGRRPDLEAVVAVGTAGAPGTAPVPGSAVERVEVEERLEDVLADAGVARARELAVDLAAVGADPDEVAHAVARLAPDGAALGLAWWVTRARAASAVRHLSESVGRISEIVGALRGYSYVDRGERQAVDVRRGLDDTLTMLAHKVPEGVVVEREYEPDLPPVPGHGGQLNQVWTNLVDNALHALGSAGRLTLRARRDGTETVLVEVADDGPGIPDDLVGRVFDPFVTSKPPGEGTGLGLNVSHQIVTEVHGGRIDVESRPGRTVFTVRLPQAAPPTGRVDP